ncbi:Vacuolar protein sorting-associated protein 13A [Cichlidogyrus casuarinus]|uniref:Vacuolar protein sorting-associated protein 13A n=1 Tax=Cichlidogyrus casuarinus TaxID=1844966 RepID=A0ABD2QL14_9PLAT
MTEAQQMQNPANYIYDLYQVQLTDFQILFMNDEMTEWHILQPCALDVVFKLCSVAKYQTGYAKMLIDGCLPVFKLGITDGTLQSVFEIMVNMPFPEPPNVNLTHPEDASKVIADSVNLGQDFLDAVKLDRLAKETQRLIENTGDFFSECLKSKYRELNCLIELCAYQFAISPVYLLVTETASVETIQNLATRQEGSGGAISHRTD